MIFSAEWTYLLTTRKVGGEDSVFSYVRIKYGENATDTVSGVIIYPDDFSFSEAGVASMKFGGSPVALRQQINAADWEALENAGCIFLPGAKMSDISYSPPLTETTFGTLVYYWSSSAYTSANKFFVCFYLFDGGLNAANSASSHNRIPVRLVQDLE